MVKAAGRDEPVMKMGSAIVHSLVVASSNHSAVCLVEKTDSSMDNSMSGMRQICKVRSLEKLAITDSHNGDLL